jgi:hypothetical protein
MFSYAPPSTPRLSPTSHQIQDEVDAVAQMEEQELEALVALAEDNSENLGTFDMEEVDIPSSPTRYGSDEEDYDDIFMEIVSSQGGQNQVGSIQSEMQDSHVHEDVDMDMSG